jgi:hypothetical protein
MLCAAAPYFQLHSQVQIPSGLAIVLAIPYAAVITYLKLTVSQSPFLLLPARLAADVSDACSQRSGGTTNNSMCMLLSYRSSPIKT